MKDFSTEGSFCFACACKFLEWVNNCFCKEDPYISNPELETQPQEPTAHDKLHWCLDNLGQRMTTVGVGHSDASVVRSWLDSDVPEDIVAKVSMLHDTAKKVSDVYDEETAIAFLRSTSPYLGDEAPVLIIAEAGMEETEAAQARELVMEAVGAFLEP